LAISTEIFETLSDSLSSVITPPEFTRFNLCVLDRDIWVAGVKSKKDNIGQISLLRYSANSSSPTGKLEVKEALNTTLQTLYPRLILPNDADKQLVKEFENPECMIAAHDKWMALLVVNNIGPGIAYDCFMFKLKLMAFRHEDIESEDSTRSYLVLEPLIGNHYFSWGKFCSLFLIASRKRRPIIMITHSMLPLYRIFKVGTSGRIISLTDWITLKNQMRGSLFSNLAIWNGFMHTQYLQASKTFLISYYTPASTSAKDKIHCTSKMHYLRAVLRGV